MDEAISQAEKSGKGFQPIRSSLWRRLARLPAGACVLLVRGYQVTLGLLLGGHCRFHPSCSHYAIDAYREWGALWGTWLTFRRLIRCHPLGGHGYDPAPLRPQPASDRPCEPHPGRTPDSRPPSQEPAQVSR